MGAGAGLGATLAFAGAGARAERVPIAAFVGAAAAVVVTYLVGGDSVLSLVDDRRHKRDLTGISAIHDLTLAAQYCDRLLLLFGGWWRREMPAKFQWKRTSPPITTPAPNS
ncbi:MAG: hypothetical protein ACRDWA_16185 [Acidimicrobiia bacterium]